MSFETDIQIAHKAKLKPIEEIAQGLGLDREMLMPFGRYKAKIEYEHLQSLISADQASKKQGHLILVSAMTPTPLGEGKTTVSIGLSQALNRIGRKSIVALREPSLGPCFGIKGGAAGGGHSQVLPMEDINLHFTGDLHAVGVSHNLISALLDNHVHYQQEPRFSLRHIFWKRVMDMNDRSLRKIIVGMDKNGLLRESGFDITAASEIMAILCLSKSYQDLKTKIGNILLGLDLHHHRPVYLRELEMQGAAAMLLKEALLPNLVQTIENTPAFIHGGPFANIAQGTSSVLATQLALRLSDFVVTEAGFGSDLGAEKFFNIVSRYGGLRPKVMVIVATCRALKYHGGVSKSHLTLENCEAIKRGFPNLKKHLENAQKFQVVPVVAINRFPSDTEEELRLAESLCRDEAGVAAAVVDVWAKGGAGAENLAQLIVDQEAQLEGREFRPLYDWRSPVQDKVRAVATEIYGAKDVLFYPEVKEQMAMIQEHPDLANLPICMAKTQYSFSDNPKLLGRPSDFTLAIRELVVASGAGFLVPITGEIMRMPGLPKVPAAQSIDIAANGEISGLF